MSKSVWLLLVVLSVAAGCVVVGVVMLSPAVGWIVAGVLTGALGWVVLVDDEGRQ
jgi:hypothetical protein